MGSEVALTEYLEEIQDRSFRWGKHDCFTFTNEAWRRMHGEPWAPAEWLTGYLSRAGRPLSRSDLSARFGYASFDDALTSRLTHVPCLPPRGALVSAYAGEGRWHVGIAFGIAVGLHAAFLGAHGVRYVPIDDIKQGWIK
jgi:hypothetical protein